MAMAELPSQSSIGTAHAVLTFDVPPKHSAPLTRGFFFVSLRAQDTFEPKLYMIPPLVDRLRYWLFPNQYGSVSPELEYGSAVILPATRASRMRFVRQR